VKEVAAIAGEYPAWESRSPAQPFVFDSDVVEPGSAAAVAAGFVPVAHGTDAFGSIRMPAAMCGLVGISPRTGTVAAEDAWQWSGVYRHGPIATTVSDAALLLSVLAQRPQLAAIAPAGVMRIAVSVRPPGLAGPIPIPKQFARVVAKT
jgi:amidase